MKLFSLLCAAFVSLAALTPATAEASPHCGERTRVSYDSCGRPIHWVYTVVRHDHCGRPVYGWVRTSRGSYASHHDDDYGHGRRYDRGYGHGGGYRGDRCESGRDYGHGYSRSRSGVSFHFSR